MIEEVIQVISTEQKQGAKGPYLEVTFRNEKAEEHKKNIFDQALWNLFQPEAWIKWYLEKEGNWWNIKKAEAAEEGFKKLVESRESDEMTKDDWEQKARIERVSIQRQVSIKSAVKLAVAEVIKPTAILSYAEVFNRYMDGNITVCDEAIFKALVAKHFKSEEEPISEP